MTRSNRGGFTLVELLVVVSILAVLATLIAIYVLPMFQDNKNVARGVDRVITTLLIAKQRALRDGHPVGVRFEVDPDDPTVISRMRYIEQPEIFSGTQISFTANNSTVTINDFDWVGSATATSDYGVQAGDWIRLANPPINTANNLEITGFGGNATRELTVRTAPGGNLTAGSSLYWLVRQAKPIPGEDVVELPQNVVINLGQVNTATTPNGVNLPPQNPSGNFEIIFRAYGGVYNRATAIPIVLWVNDKTKPANEPNTSKLIAVYPRTGLVAGHDVSPTGNPLAFALDGRSSGL